MSRFSGNKLLNIKCWFSLQLSSKTSLILKIIQRDINMNVHTSSIQTRCGRDLPHPSRPALGPTQPLIKWVPGLLLGGKATGIWRWPSTSSSADVKERVKLHLYSPSGPSWPVLGRNLPSYFLHACSCRVPDILVQS